MAVNFFVNLQDILKRESSMHLENEKKMGMTDGPAIDFCRAVAYEFMSHFRSVKNQKPEIEIKGDEVVTLVSIVHNDLFVFITESESTHDVRAWSVGLKNGRVKWVRENEAYSDYLPVNKGKRMFAVIENG